MNNFLSQLDEMAGGLHICNSVSRMKRINFEESASKISLMQLYYVLLSSDSILPLVLNLRIPVDKTTIDDQSIYTPTHDIASICNSIFAVVNKYQLNTINEVVLFSGLLSCDEKYVYNLIEEYIDFIENHRLKQLMQPDAERLRQIRASNLPGRQINKLCERLNRLRMPSIERIQELLHSYLSSSFFPFDSRQCERFEEIKSSGVPFDAKDRYWIRLHSSLR